MARQDYLLDDDFDLKIENGDFVQGESDDRHAQLIALGAPGFIRQFPECGFHAIRFKNSSAINKQKFESELKAQLLADGYKKVEVIYSGPEWWKDFNINLINP